MEWKVYTKEGEERYTVTSIEYNGEWMGETSVTFSVESPKPIEFRIGDWLEYRGERFELHYEPEVAMTALPDTSGDAYKYENIKFLSLAEEMVNCDFLDYVLNDNKLHFSGLPEFSFYADTVRDLADRIQANMDRYCEQNGLPKWDIEVEEGTTGYTGINIAVTNISCFDALALVNTQFGVNYTIKGRQVKIGSIGLPVGHIFKMGKDLLGNANGLYELDRQAETDQKIVTRLRAYGSERNLPRRYYNSLTDADGVKIVPDNMAINRLMLPSFPYETLDPYIDSPNIKDLGVIEDTITFDGSGDLEEIFPSIEGATAEELEASGYPTTAEGRLDELIVAQQIEDDGVGYEIDGEIYPGIEPEDGKAPDGLTEDMIFYVFIKDIGFDIMDYLTDEAPTISFKSGMLGGRDFEICTDEEHKPHQTENKVWMLALKRVYDDAIKLWFPYKYYNAKSDDRFVLLGIDMPELYIKMSANRLLSAATEWLSKNDYARSVYTPKVDEIYMAQQHEMYLKGQALESLYLTIKEGNLLMFEEESLHVGIASIYIDKLTIKEGSEPIPVYEVTLREEKVVGALQRIQNQIDSIKSGGFGSGGSGGYNAEQIKQMIKAFGEQYFISKIKPDATPYDLTIGGVLYAIESFIVGRYLPGESGAMINRQGVAEIRSIMAREYARILGDLFVGDYIPDNMGAHIDFDGNTELGSLLVRLDAVFKGALSSPDFISGFLDGYGWALTPSTFTNPAGGRETRYTLEIDNLIVRNTMRIYELIVSQLLGENDNRVFTAMLEVDHYDPQTGIIWLDTMDGKFYNPFRVGDYIMVQQFNGMPSEDNGYYVTKHYEFIVTEVGLGDLSDGIDRKDWLKFESFFTTIEGGTPETLITKGDSITRVDNLTDEERKGFIQIISVGSKTPYLDVVYGLKTDPANSLKARLGNLQGIRHHLFGWLQGWGLYSQNVYLVGDYRLRRSGDNVEAEIQMLKDRFASQYSEISYDVTEEENLLYNPTFTENMEGWEETAEDTTSIIWDDSTDGDGYDGGLLMNGNLFLTEGDDARWAMLDYYDERKMLHIWKSGVRQKNALILQKIKDTGKSLTHTEYDTDTAVTGDITGEFDEEGNLVKNPSTSLADNKGKTVPNTLFLSIQFKAETPGTLKIGFTGGSGKFGEYASPMSVPVNDTDNWQTIEWQGTWDGKGDFILEYDGEIWVRLLSLTDDPLTDYKNEYGTLIEQTARNIRLVAWNVGENKRSTGILIDALTNSVTIWAQETKANGRDIAQLIVDTKSITARVESAEGNIGQLQVTADMIDQRVTAAEGNYASLTVTANEIKSEVNDMQGNITNIIQTANGIEQRVRSAEGEISQIKQTADDINLKVTGLQNNVASIDVRVTENEAQIEQKVSVGGVIAAINMYAQTDGQGSLIKIQADKVEIEGGLTINNVFQVTEDRQIIIKGAFKEDSTYGDDITKHNIVYLTASTGSGNGSYMLGIGEQYVGQRVKIYNPGTQMRGVIAVEFAISNKADYSSVRTYWISPGETIEVTCFKKSATRAEWILTGRTNYQMFETYTTQGSFPLCLAVGHFTINHSAGTYSLSGRMFDGRQLMDVMTVNRTGIGQYEMSFSSNLLPLNYIVMCQALEGYYTNGTGVFDGASVSVSVLSKTSTKIIFVASDDDTANDCSFDFMIFNTDYWHK